MISSIPNLILLLDHSNIPYSRVTFQQILNAWLPSIESFFDSNIGSIQVRAYGGWFNGCDCTDERFTASSFYQNHCPSVHFLNNRYYRITFNFADELIVDAIANGNPSSTYVTHTVQERYTPIRFQQGGSATQCSRSGCQLIEVKRWFHKNRACTFRDCPRKFEEVWVRKEQKQVDVHIASDLIALAGLTDHPFHICLVSDDRDFLPAIATAAKSKKGKSSITLTRFDVKHSYLDGVLGSIGVNLVTL